MKLTEAGEEIDGEFDVDSVDGVLSFTMHSHGGASQRNHQYGDALRVILSRLAARDALLTDAQIVSSRALQSWPSPEDRRLRRQLEWPIRLRDHDPERLRMTLMEAQRTAARDRSLGAGGNNRRRTKFFVTVPGAPSARSLAAYLAVGAVSDIREDLASTVRGATALTSGSPALRHARAQGYVADAAYRRAVELRAMELAIEHFESDWTVEDTSAGNPYDLVLRNGDEKRFVEVKGTAGLGEQINLTANEVHHARQHAGQVILYLVHGIRVDRSNPAEPRASGGISRVIEKLELDAGDLRPTAYRWSVPRR